MQKDKKFYDNFFLSHGSDIHNDPVRFAEIAKLCKGRVLDVACGTGTLSDYYNNVYFGVDISDVAIKHAKSIRRKTANFAVADVLNFDFKDYEDIGTIVIAEFLEHVESASSLFDNLNKHLKPGTRLIISVPNGDRIPDESHCREFTVPQLRKGFSPFGRVRFHNYAGFNARILMSVDIGEKAEDLIALVLPVKNEVEGLETAILSCIDYVDQIVVSVDTKSYDQTLNMARRYADVVKKYKWEDSFAKARMFAQEGISSKWCLQLDGHEYVKTFPIDEIRKLGDYDCAEIDIVLESGFTFHFPRLVRNYVKWGGDVHNYPIVKSRCPLSSLIIQHDREHLQSKEAIKLRDEQRKKMVAEIFNAELKKDKRKARPYFYLGQQSFIEKNFKQAIKFYKKYLKYSKHKGERWLICLNLAQSHVFLGHHLRALWALRDADKEISNRWEIHKFRGVVYSMLKKYDLAVKSFVESLSINPGHFTYCPEKRNDSETWDFIAHSLCHLDKLTEAKFAWKHAVELEMAKPKEERDQVRLKLINSMLDDK